MRDGRDGSRLSARPLRYCCRLGFRLWSRVDKVRGKFVLDALHYRVDLGGLGDVELETRNIEPEFPGHPPGPALKRCGFLSAERGDRPPPRSCYSAAAPAEASISWRRFGSMKWMT